MTFQSPPIPASTQAIRPYVCARHICKDEGWIYLDANESPFTIDIPPPSIKGINRYSDPTTDVLRDEIAAFYGIRREQIIMTNGTDELIDLAIRTFVRPKNSVLSVAPTYGMYRVCADICGSPYVSIPLTSSFGINEEQLSARFSEADILFLCSPNNPTGNSIPIEMLDKIVNEFKGLIVIDEAYGEFADANGIPSAIELVKNGAKNLLVMRTFSKAFGAAGIRLGYGIADSRVTEQLFKTKPPYNVNLLTQRMGVVLWGKREQMEKNVRLLLKKRKRVEEACMGLGCTVYPSDANFFLMRLPEKISSNDMYERLRNEKKIIVRNFGSKPQLENCLRISTGTQKENDLLIASLSSLLS